MESLKNSFRIASIIVGTVVGAGFASGQEIMQFFTSFQDQGAKGIILAAIIFCLVCIAVLSYSYRNKNDKYSIYIQNIAGKYAGGVIEIIVMLFLLVGFFVMIAGCGAFFNETTGMSTLWGAALMALLCWLVFLFDIRGVTVVNVVLAPLLIMGIIILGFYFGLFRGAEAMSGQNPMLIGDWFSSSLIYVSYNSIILIAILPSLMQYLDSKKSIYLGAILGTGALCAMALIIYSITGDFYNVIQDFQIPIIKVLKEQNPFMTQAYGIVLLVAMFTSCVCSGFCFLNKAANGKTNKMRTYALFICILAVPISLVSFSGMIKWLYPIFGYIGLFQVILVIFDYFLNRNRAS